MLENTKQQSIGGLWEYTGKSGTYFKGYIKDTDSDEKIDIIVFQNKIKKLKKHPDWFIYFNNKQSK